MLDAVQSIMAGSAAVKNVGEQITLLETKGPGVLPYEKLIERLDRIMASIWRGSDLSTMSRGTKRRPGRQRPGRRIARSSSATTRNGSARRCKRSPVRDQIHIRRRRAARLPQGPHHERQDVAADIAADTFLLNAGAPLEVEATLERYGREVPKAGATLLKPIAPLGQKSEGGLRSRMVAAAIPSATNVTLIAEAFSAFLESPEGSSLLDNAIKKKFGASPARTAEMISAGLQQFGEARRKDFNPLAVRLLGILSITHDDEQRGALVHLKTELPKFLKQINKAPTAAPVLASVMSASFFNGMAEATQERRAA
jgi:hypothetical protein